MSTTRSSLGLRVLRSKLREIEKGAALARLEHELLDRRIEPMERRMTELREAIDTLERVEAGAGRDEPDGGPDA